MDDFRLRVFREAAERLNFTQAAEALRLTQPAVTLQVKKLEQDLGVRLFDRSGGRVTLTAAGAALLGYARRIGALYEEARREMGLLAGERRGTLRIGASTTISQYILPRLVGAFAGTHREVRFSVASGNTETVIEWLGDGRIELGMIEGPAHRGDVRTETFMEDDIVPIVPREHEWAGRKAGPVTIAMLAESPLLIRERGSGTRQVVEAALEAAGVDVGKLKIVMELDATEAIKTAVEAGMGVGLVSRWAILNSTGLREVEVSGLRVIRDMSFVYPQGPELDGLGGAFIHFVRDFGPELLGAAL